MRYGIRPEIAEATRLTRLGKLAEATALLQRLLKGERAPNPGSGAPPAVTGAEHASVDAKQPKGRPTDEETRPRTSLRETVKRLAAMAKASRLDRGFRLRRAPEPVPDGASFETATYSNAAGTRNYKLYIPSNRTSEKLPLIVMLHGCTQNPDDFAAGTRMNALAEEKGFLVAYPEQPASANANHCWNWFMPEDQRRGAGEPSLIAGITRQIMDKHNIDPLRVYIAGLSAGGAAAAIMGEAYPDLYAAAGVHSGLPSGAAHDLPSAFDAMRVGAKVERKTTRIARTIVFHGDKDAVVHPSNGDAVTSQALGAASELKQTIRHGQGARGHAYSRSIHADAQGQTICEQWVILGGGHAWSGGSPSGSHTDPLGPDASREMVRFFWEHRRSS